MLCVEKIFHIVFEAVQKGHWKPVKAAQFGLAVSHLFFADDLILFTEASARS